LHIAGADYVAAAAADDDDNDNNDNGEIMMAVVDVVAIKDVGCKR